MLVILMRCDDNARAPYHTRCTKSTRYILLLYSVSYNKYRRCIKDVFARHQREHGAATNRVHFKNYFYHIQTQTVQLYDSAQCRLMITKKHADRKPPIFEIEEFRVTIWSPLCHVVECLDSAIHEFTHKFLPRGVRVQVLP